MVSAHTSINKYTKVSIKALLDGDIDFAVTNLAMAVSISERENAELPPLTLYLADRMLSVLNHLTSNMDS